MSSLNIVGGIDAPLQIKKTDIFELIYPVGSVYLTMSANNPADTFGGTWEQLAEGYTLWTATEGAGETIDAGLPNIVGTMSSPPANDSDMYIASVSGAISGYTKSVNYSNNTSNTNSAAYAGFSFDASRCSEIYNDDITTVQPPAIKVYMWKRTA